MIKHILVPLALGSIVLPACEKDKKKHADVSAELRSTGTLAMNLTSVNDPQSMTATIESYRVPISSIRLATGLTGSGYTSASPNFYSCPGTTDAECAVDLTNPSVLQNLLQGSGQVSIEVSDTKTYEGVAVELCHEHPGADGGYFPIWIKASFDIDGTTYYTNQAATLAATGPAEEIEIKSTYGGCGVTSPLVQPVVLAPETAVSIVLYGDPAGSVFGAESKPSSTQSCAGTSTDSLFICSDFVAIFGTVDSAAPVIERYLIDVPNRNDGVLTFAFDSSGQPFGAAVKGIYSGSREDPAIGFMNFHGITGDDTSGYTFATNKGNGTTYDFFAGFTRNDHTGTLTTEFEGSFPYTATKL